MSIADLLGFGCLPMVGLGGLLLGSLNRSNRPPGDLAVWVGVLMIGVPLFLVIFIYQNDTELLAFDASVSYLLIGAAMLIVIWKDINFVAMPGRDVLMVVVGVSFFALGSWYIAGDFLVPRLKVVGVVKQTSTTRGKAGVHYHVQLDDKYYDTIGKLFDTLRAGDRIEADVGRASDTIFRIRPAPTR